MTDGRSGSILPDASVGSLAAAIGRLGADTELERKLRAGALEDGAGWTIERTTDRILALLEGAIAGRPRAVFLGGSTVAPATADVLGRLEVLGRRFRTTVVGTGAPGMRRIGTVRAIAVPHRPTSARVALGTVAAIAAAAGRRSAIVCQSPYEAIGVEALARVLPPAVRPRVVVEVHGDWRTAGRLYGVDDRGGASARAERLATRALVRADRVRAVGRFTASLARDSGFGGPVDRFPAFADYGTFADAVPEVEPEPDAVAFVGALERVKGIDVLLDAWPLVRARRPAAVLRIAGTGALAREVRARAAALGGVEVLGPLDVSEVRRLLDRSSVVAVPSRSEGLGRVILEAFARSRPVVASDVGGIAELVDERSGVLVPPEDRRRSRTRSPCCWPTPPGRRRSAVTDGRGSRRSTPRGRSRTGSSGSRDGSTRDDVARLRDPDDRRERSGARRRAVAGRRARGTVRPRHGDREPRRRAAGARSERRAVVARAGTGDRPRGPGAALRTVARPRHAGGACRRPARPHVPRVPDARGPGREGPRVPDDAVVRAPRPIARPDGGGRGGRRDRDVAARRLPAAVGEGPT